jgi:hypothetical protein
MSGATKGWLLLLLFCVGGPATAAPAIPASDAMATRRDRMDRIVVPVRINGRGPFHFMLDTGATRTVLSDSVLADLGLSANPDRPLTVIGVSGSLQVASVHIESIDAGELHFRELDLPVLGGPILAGLDGILGMDGLEGLRLSEDFIHDRTSIIRSTGRRTSFPYSVVPVQFLSQRLLVADAYVGNVRARAIIDTGGPGSIGNLALLAALTHGPDAHKRGLQVPVLDATQALQQGVLARVPTLRLGAADIERLDVAFGDFHVFRSWGLQSQPAILIGMDVLGTFAELAIDYRRRELLLLMQDNATRGRLTLDR